MKKILRICAFILIGLCPWTSLINDQNLQNSLFAAGLKKVLIPEFVNEEKKEDYKYLEASISNAVENLLTKKFAFIQADKEKWKKVAKDNYIFEHDYFTETAAINLGLLSKQDIVISGEFKITGEKKIKIITSVRIFDLSKKEIISQFQVTGPADNRIWDSVDQIASKIADEAKTVLPTKEEWARSGLSGGESLPLFDHFELGARIGGGLYALEYADRIKAQLPAISLNFQANMPVIWRKLNFFLQGTYLKESPIEGKNPNIEGLKIVTSNYLLQSFIGIDFHFNSIGIMPKAGGGMILQSISVTGIRNEDLTNSLPFAGAGVDLSYGLTHNLDMVLAIESLAEFEKGKLTLLNLASLGVKYAI